MKKYYYCIWLGIALIAFSSITFLDWEFYAIVIPTIILESLNNQKDEKTNNKL